MKANRGLRIPPILAAAAAMAMVASCSERRVIPTPVPTPMPRPVPPPSPSPVSRLDWRDAPITPGEWRWNVEGGQSIARFANGVLVLRCDPAGRTITLQRAGTAQTPVPVTILTSNGNRTLFATPQPGSFPILAVSFAANDRMLDSIAFSRGRFAVETAGLPTLYVPSWAEVGKVVEDCR